MDVVIFDIDGTLADLTHRLHHIKGHPKNYDLFYGAVNLDTPIDAIVFLAKRLNQAQVPLVLCSGRPDSARSQTEAWLSTHVDVPYVSLYMRKTGDYRADHIIKQEILVKMREEGFNPILAIDDRPRIVAMWRANNVPCLQCRDWVESERRNTSGPLTLMVGPMCAGKSTWLRNAGIHPSHIISSDQLRADLCADFKDQSRNDEIFAVLHTLVKTRLDAGLPTVVDATNIRNRDRKAITNLSANGTICYVVINRPMAEKKRDAEWRPHVWLERHEQTFRSNIKDILAGDNNPRVTVLDLRSESCRSIPPI